MTSREQDGNLERRGYSIRRWLNCKHVSPIGRAVHADQCYNLLPTLSSETRSNMILRIALLFALLCFSAFPSLAQVQPSRAAAIDTFKRGEFAQAIKMLKKAVKENENDAASWYMLGSAYLKTGKNKDAIKALEKGAKL